MQMKVECYSVWKNEPLKRNRRGQEAQKSHGELCKAANVGHNVIQQQSTRHDCCSGTNIWLKIIHALLSLRPQIFVIPPHTRKCPSS